MLKYFLPINSIALRVLSLLLLGMGTWFHTSAQFVLNGQATALGGDCYRLTTTSNFVLGTAWNSTQINLNQPFDLRFEVFLGCSDSGADGLVFGLQPVSTSAGTTGQGMGFGGISPSLGVEFDTYQNTNFADPVFDHLALVSNGDVNHNTSNTLTPPVSIAANGANVEDCQNHDVRVVWEPQFLNLKVYFDCNLRINHTFPTSPVSSIFNNNPMVFWGFTSATGGSNNEHRFCLNTTTFLPGQPQYICRGDTVQLTASGGVNYTWNTSAGLSDSSIANPVAYPNGTTQYIVEIEDACGVTFWDTALVVVDQPVAVDLGNDTTVCGGTLINLNAQQPAPNSTYLWNNGSTAATLQASTAGVYWVEVQSPNGTCVASDSIAVDIINPPVVDLGNDTSICQGSPITLSVGADSASYTWSTGATNNQIQVGQAGNYSVTIANPCGSASDTITVQVIDAPTVTVSPNQTACEGDTVELVASALGADQITWSTGQMGNALSVTASGSFTATASNVCGTATDNAVVSFTYLPEVILPTDTVSCTGEPFVLIAQTENADDLSWNNGLEAPSIAIDTPGIYQLVASNGCGSDSAATSVLFGSPFTVDLGPNDTLCPGETMPVAAPEGYAAYAWSNGTTGSTAEIAIGTHFLTVTDDLGCTASDSIRIIDYCPADFHVPNAFTPNGDGLNDLFRVESIFLRSFEFRIFNRWGEELFSTNQLEEGWDGTFKGILQPDGVYVWHLTYATANRSTEHRLGKVVLINR